MSLRATIRQWRYPREFRIEPVGWPSDVLSMLNRLAEQPVSGPPSEAAAMTDVERRGPIGVAPPDLGSLSDVATGLWRLRKRMCQPGTDEPLPESGRAYRHLEATWDALSKAGVKIQDHDDLPYDSGLSLKVLAFQPQKDTHRERVIETIRPSVYYDDRCIQLGEVIVGTPAEPGEDVS